MIGIWHGLVIDCAEPRELATFYERLLGYVRVNDFEDWVVIGISADQPGIAFQQIPNYVAPVWPSGDVPTQMHIDVRVEDLQSAADAAITLGASLLKQSSESFWVLADPAGHPFCLVRL